MPKHIVPNRSPTPHLILHERLSAFLDTLEVNHGLFEHKAGKRISELVVLQDAEYRLTLVGQIFGLSDSEQAVLALALAQETFPLRFRILAAASLGLQEDILSASLTAYLCLTWLENADPAALLEEAPLLNWGLLRTGEGLTPDQSMKTLSVAPGVLAFVQGHDGPDPELAEVANLLQGAGSLSDSQEAQVTQARKFLTQEPDTRGVVFYGTAATALAAVAVQALGDGDRRVLKVDAAAIASRPNEARALARAVGRDSRLKNLRVVVDATGDIPEEQSLEDTIQLLLNLVSGPVGVLSPTSLPLRSERAFLPLEVTPPTPSEGRERWATALDIREDEPTVKLLGDQFRFSLDQIDLLAREARAALPAKASPTQRAERAWEAARTANRHLMGALAQRVSGDATWTDLVLPEADRRVLEQIVAHIRHRSTVYETLGMAHSGRGKAVAALFSGPSGTGKTLSAEVLANELKLDLYRVDLASTVSKYIGDTEKNLRRIFDAAEAGGCILLFDEADSVFGKRTEVRHANDRYANVQVNYLLQRMETFGGLTILTTNLESSMDSAFMRRIGYVLNFRAPGYAERERLWRRVFPATLDLSEVDFAWLARAELSGGSIRSVATNAVFMSVARGEPLGTELLREALLLEYRKQGRMVLDGDWLSAVSQL